MAAVSWCFASCISRLSRHGCCGGLGAGCIALLLLARLAVAAPPPGYYDSVQGRSGNELRRVLHSIMAGHRVVPYSTSSSPDTSDALMVLDEDPDDTNSVRLIYSRRAELKRTFGQTTGWNREHLWPNSYGLDSVQPAHSDLHNLRGADATVNSARGNKFYDGGDTSDPGYRRPGHVEAPETSTDSDSWEPPNAEKGDIARALFYMDVRYEGDMGEPDLVLTEAVALIGSETNFMGRLRTLLRWHLADPVDDLERRRNDLVFERYQRNRNPFVDHPEWVLLVFVDALPRLSVSVENDKLRIQWDAAFSNAGLESTSDFGLPWRSVTTPAMNRGGRWVVLEPMTGSSRFFRLRVE